jgi:hypothetical protein
MWIVDGAPPKHCVHRLDPCPQRPPNPGAEPCQRQLQDVASLKRITAGAPGLPGLLKQTRDVLVNGPLSPGQLARCGARPHPTTVAGRGHRVGLGEKMKGVNRKNRVTVYYVLADRYGELSLFG